jgi:hypothetical protein
VINGNDILALGWPAGKVIGLELESASALKSRGLSRDELLAELQDVGRDAGTAHFGTLRLHLRPSALRLVSSLFVEEL